jgi:micrococcal nuclease
MAPFFMPGPFLKPLLPLIFVILSANAHGAPAVTTPGCNNADYDETAAVRYVHDGDTLVLKDGRKLRLLGYNTPELGRDRRPPEPLAVESQQHLQQWISGSGSQIRLKYDFERRDRYGRALAHAFTQDGHSIAALMLQQGLAASLIMPPNLAFADCYAQAEQQARNMRLGVWSLPAYKPVALTDSVDLKGHKNRYTVLQAAVFEVEQDTKGLILWLGGYEFAVKVRLTIDNDDLPLFPLAQLKKSQGRKLEARGWLHRQNDEWNMRIRHPSNLQIGSQSVTNQRPSATP